MTIDSVATERFSPSQINEKITSSVEIVELSAPFTHHQSLMPGVVVDHDIDEDAEPLPRYQSALLLNKLREPYTLSEQHEVPELSNQNEVLIKIQAIGLNPIDWKAPDFGFGIPSLPHISGRDFAGVVVKTSSSKSRVKKGDTVVSIATDYRDIRKAAFQQYAVANEFNISRISKSVDAVQSAPVGVAFVAAALTLGICLGIDFSTFQGSAKGPDLLKLVRSVGSAQLPGDIAPECLAGIQREDAPKAGDWIVVWGGSSTTAFFITQLAKLAGCRVILVVDVAKHGARLSQSPADLLVDSADRDRAVGIIRHVTGGLKYAVDTSGRDTATKLLQAFPTAATDPQVRSHVIGHLVGLTGLPKEKSSNVTYHAVPIKVFHEVQAVGEALTTWLETLLAESIISTPDVTIIDGSLSAVNDALDIMRKGEISGRRLVIRIDS